MKRTLNHILLLAIVIVASTGCTRNNGNIGVIFGTWKLDAINISKVTEGSETPTVTVEEKNDVFWGFQNGVLMMERMLPYHSVERVWGSWKYIDDETRMIIDFNHSDDKHQPGQPPYNILSGLHLPAKTQSTLSVKRLDRSAMVLTYEDAEASTVYTYFFTKW